MKTLLFLLFTLGVGQYFGQNEITSFYFQESQPKGENLQNKFEPEVCGVYLYEEDTLKKIIVTTDSIYSRFSLITFVTKKELRKSKKYHIEGDKIYGIRKKQGLPYAKRHDTLFVVLVQNDIIFKPSENQELKKQGDLYFLNYKQDNGYYSTEVLAFSDKKAIFYSIDHDPVMEQILAFKDIESKQLDGFKTYLAAPTRSELLSFFNEKGFRDFTTYLHR